MGSGKLVGSKYLLCPKGYLFASPSSMAGHIALLSLHLPLENLQLRRTIKVFGNP